MIWTPRPYLSYSQLILIERDPLEYVQQYIFNRKGYESAKMRTGTRVHKAMEDQERPVSFNEASLYNLLPTYEYREYQVETQGRHCKLLGKIDCLSLNPLHVGDYKIGTTKWNQRMVDNHDQFDFYGLILFGILGQIPKFFIHHGNPITGEVQTFETSRSESDLMLMSARTGKAWRKIQDICSNYAQPTPQAI